MKKISKEELDILQKNQPELFEKVSALLAEHDNCDATIKDLKEENAGLQKENGDLMEENKELENLRGENADLQAKVESLSEQVDAPLTVEHDGKEYRFTLKRFHLANHPVEVSAEEAALDEELIDKILSIRGQSILKEIV